ncbi:Flavin reductase like domain protein [Pseudooceanicola marinus]|uniref:Flavin reductase like domain protein n=1 Tax=Pseudooceanicola marinus TaxID=396013 RepID=A0A1X6Z4K7_9RHOB|nr:flavin reductase family protein [Pseudooceanicola marinus]PJE32271.1 flavin reductase family protein [Pseudooceanicola marinus]SLN40563.1 Flavin reductase like domain protein [Pseudooceanicola marinus]
MHVDPSDLSAQQSYRLLSGIVVPRPIAWVSSLNASGNVNLAPYSTFTFVAPKPPMVGFSAGRKGSVYKDTVHNIMSRETYVVHIADRSLMEPLHESAEEVGPEVSEAEMLGLGTCASDCIEVPRLAAAPIAMECRLRQVLEFGDTRSRFIVGEVLRFHIRDGLVTDGKIDSAELDPICRLAGPNYATLGEIRTLRAMKQTKKHSGA